MVGMSEDTTKRRWFRFSLRTMFVVMVVLACSLGWRIGHSESTEGAGASQKHPLIAIWRRDEGLADSKAPYLRVAIWHDGTVLFAKDPSKWSHDLRRGKLAQYRVDQLKQSLIDSGVFQLAGTCYLVPDLPTDCIMIDLGTKKQMLYWDEIEVPNYGINGTGKPQHREFKRCWKMVNHLAMIACPDQFELENKRFDGPPKSWYIKEANQSE